MARYLYNLFYSLNPFPEKNAEYAPDVNQELPALPDLTHYYSPYTIFGSQKQLLDPRFPRNNSDRYKQCFANFAVWRKCLEEHTEDYDETAEDAKICKSYKNLAIHSCPAGDFKSLREQAEKDSFVALLGLNSRKADANPTIVVMDDEHYIVKVVRPNSKDSRNWKEGDRLGH